MANVVITGSTRGIGLGIARELVRRGHAVVVSGRTPEATARAVAGLQAAGSGRVEGIACDVARLPDVEALWAGAVARLGRVDIWLNNAGQAHETHRFWQQPPGILAPIVATNLTGLMHGCHVAMRGMLAQQGGPGAIYNMTGFGRTNLFQPGMAIYGATKRAVDYFSKALAKEAAGTGVIVGQVNPGMVVTDMLRQGYTTSVRNPDSIRRLYNILASTPDEAAGYLVDRILANRQSGVLINREPRRVVLAKLLSAPFRRVRRDVLAPQPMAKDS